MCHISVKHYDIVHRIIGENPHLHINCGQCNYGVPLSMAYDPSKQTGISK